MARPGEPIEPSTRAAMNAAPPTTIERSLAQISPGGGGRVVRISGDPDFRQRLLELGVVPGSEVRVVRSAPLGDPLEIDVRGYRLSLRRAEASTVSVDAPVDPAGILAPRACPHPRLPPAYDAG